MGTGNLCRGHGRLLGNVARDHAGDPKMSEIVETIAQAFEADDRISPFMARRLAREAIGVIGIGRDRYRHKARGTTYRVLFEAAKASSTIEALDHMTMVVYQCEESGLVWVKPAIEFFDGRYERI
jgi:hypothetical protein